MGISMSGGITPSGSIKLTSNNPPTWTTSSVGPFNDNSSVNFQFIANDPEQGTPGLAFSVVSGSLSGGLSLSSSGLLSGTTDDVGSTTVSNFTLRVTDNGGLFADRAFSITVNDVFSANPVHFNGTNTYLRHGGLMTGLIDTKKCLCSFWYRQTALSTGVLIGQESDTGGGGEYRIRISNGGGLSLLGRTTSRAITLDARTSDGAFSLNTWVHVLISYDLSLLPSSSTVQIYINDVSDVILDTNYTTANNNIDYTGDDWGIGANWSTSPGQAKINADVAELWWHHNLRLNLDTTSNRRKFITADLKPVDLGSDGSDTTGVTPIIYLSGPTVSWHTNKGSGDGFNETGALTDGTGPVEV